MKVKNYDLIYIHLWGTPYGLPIFEKLLTLVAKKLVYDIDDLIFLGNTSEANSALKNLKSSKKVHFLMKNADYVITCTPVLDTYVKKFNSNSSDISSTVDTDNRYLFDKNRYTSSEKITIGWTGSHSTSKYLYLLTDVLKKLAQEFDFRLIVMGDKSFHIDGVHFEAMIWNEGSEMEVLNTFDIGLYPLPDEPWIYGKSSLKAIQYQALGIPVVASKLGTNTRVIRDNETGFLVQWDSEDEWYTNIKLLIENAELRQKMGIQGRKHIEENYSVSSTKQVYLDVLNKVLSS
jgi:glycosyltransferase involved in cell wall biosynthesis